MQLQDVLFTQGFGTRRVCAGLIQQGLVQFREAGREHFQPVRGLRADHDVDPQGLWFQVQGVAWPYAERAYLMLHKPAGTECSHKPGAHPSIYTLLPSPLRMRPQKSAVQGVQAVGRLDQDTTGLLLLTDDGQFIHRMSSPRHHVPKVYEVRLRHPLQEAQVRRLLDGVVLEDDPRPVRAAACTLVDALHLQPDADRGQVPPGQAHDRRGGQPGRGTAPGTYRRTWRCRPTCSPASGAGWTTPTWPRCGAEPSTPGPAGACRAAGRHAPRYAWRHEPFV
jgi:16S rRNA pseudouridine516 synthase